MKTCLNPDCATPFKPGHYGDRQVVCSTTRCQDWHKKYLLETRRVPRGVPDEALEKILAAASSNRVMKSLIVVARDSGLRKGELLGLSWDDVLSSLGRVKATLSIRGQWDDAKGFRPTKVRGSRVAYLSERSREALAAFYLWSKKSIRGFRRADRVWPISESIAWRRFTQYQKRARVRNPETGYPYRFHDLRHSVGVELVKAGRLDLAQKMLGHRKLETTMLYSERSPEEIINDVERIRRAARGSA